MGFTPLEAFIGSVLVGISSSSFMLYHGRVMGCSGMMSMIMTNPQTMDTLWRLSFVVGILIASFGMSLFNDQYGAFDDSLEKLSYGQAFCAGFLVGLGSNVGNGCTSGHSICGISRLSIRSMVYTITFMAAGFVTVMVNDESQAVARENGETWPPPVPDWINNSINVAMLCTSLGMFAVLALCSLLPGAKRGLRHLFLCLTAGAAGMTFAFGMGASGMSRPSKVLAFLHITDLTYWDPSLCIVMGVGIGMTLVMYRFAWWVLRKPFFGDKFLLTLPWIIDGKLLAGGIMFGVGWGMAGICPGPMLVNMVRFDFKIYTFLFGFVVAVYAFFVFNKVETLMLDHEAKVIANKAIAAENREKLEKGDAVPGTNQVAPEEAPTEEDFSKAAGKDVEDPVEDEKETLKGEMDSVAVDGYDALNESNDGNATSRTWATSRSSTNKPLLPAITPRMEDLNGGDQTQVNETTTGSVEENTGIETLDTELPNENPPPPPRAPVTLPPLETQ